MSNLHTRERPASTRPASLGLSWPQSFDIDADTLPSSARRQLSDWAALRRSFLDPSFIAFLRNKSVRSIFDRETFATESLSSRAQRKSSEEEHSTGDQTVYAVDVLHKSIEAVEYLRNLEDGWADEESIAPTETAIGDAFHFLAKLPPGIPEPRVSAATDGEIVIELKKAGLEAVVGIEGDGGFGYALLVDDEFIAGKYEGVVAQDLPRDLSEYLSAMSK